MQPPPPPRVWTRVKPRLPRPDQWREQLVTRQIVRKRNRALRKPFPSIRRRTRAVGVVFWCSCDTRTTLIGPEVDVAVGVSVRTSAQAPCDVRMTIAKRSRTNSVGIDTSSKGRSGLMCETSGMPLKPFRFRTDRTAQSISHSISIREVAEDIIGYMCNGPLIGELDRWNLSKPGFLSGFAFSEKARRAAAQMPRLRHCWISPHQ